jgi:hypothetical protein
MSTRADFYIKKSDNKLEWLGSIAFDGYDIGVIEKAKTEIEFKKYLNEFFEGRNDVTLPSQGWPWPWNNSKLTDECYVWITDTGTFLGKAGDGRLWKMWEGEDYKDYSIPAVFIPANENPGYDDNTDTFSEPIEMIELCVPDMSHLKKIAVGMRSGLIRISLND